MGLMALRFLKLRPAKPASPKANNVDVLDASGTEVRFIVLVADARSLSVIAVSLRR
jgi:hypothetical protein